jgi:uncharacterized protein YjiS (DUF1127 family)
MDADELILAGKTRSRGRWRALRLLGLTAWRRRATRRRIAALDTHALKDIGVSYAEAETEANKPFWRA